MDAAKIRLSPEEAALVARGDVILTKNRVMEKARLLLEELQAAQLDWLKVEETSLPAEALLPVPKISKGENYRGLPYLVLDHPRLFEKEHVLTIRTLFWWGHFFSTTLHLSGRYKNNFEERIIHSLTWLQEQEYFICSNEDPWEHHFAPDNYIALSGLSAGAAEAMIRERSFIKLSRKIGLDQWDTAERSLLTLFTQLTGILSA